MRALPGPVDGSDAAAARLDTVESALVEIAAGRPVVVVDDQGPDGEGCLVAAAEAVTPTWMAFTVRHTSGLVCVAMTGQALDRLGIPPMVPRNEERAETAYAVSVDARSGVTTGISARDRAHTARVLADPEATAGDLSRPGHVQPLRVRDGGVLVRAACPEAAVDLARLAGTEPVGVLAQMVEDDGSIRSASSCQAFADEHGLAMISVAELAACRRRQDAVVRRLLATPVSTQHGVLTAIGYGDQLDGAVRIALVAGLGEAERFSDGENVPVSLHTECLTGEVLGTSRCDCGRQLDASIERIASVGRGVVIYLGSRGSRAIGLLAELRSCALSRDPGLGALDHVSVVGHPIDADDSWAATDILTDLGVRSAHLLTDDPAHEAALRRRGIDVRTRFPLPGVEHDDVRPPRDERERSRHERSGRALALLPGGVVEEGPVPTWSRPRGDMGQSATTVPLRTH